MKYFFFFVLLICLLPVYGQTDAQPQKLKGFPFPTSTMSGIHLFPDSIRVEFQDPSALVILQFKSVAQCADKTEAFFKSFPDLVQLVAKSIPDVSKAHQIDIRDGASPEHRIVVTEVIAPTTQISAKDKEITQLLPPGWEFHIHTKDGEVYVYAQTFEQLKAVTGYKAEPVIQMIREAAEPKGLGRKRMVARIIVQKEAVAYHEIKFEMPEDFLVGTGSAGIGFLNDKFYPELNATIHIRRGDHFNRPNSKITLTYNNMFFMEPKSDGSYAPKINSFLNLGWSKNADGSGQFIGFGAGYLIHRSGSFFKGNTAKFFITKDIGHFNVAPEFYLTNGFKDFQMGIKLNFTF